MRIIVEVNVCCINSLRTLGLTEPISPLVIPSRHGKHFEGVRLDAGADLLNHYQFQWCRMREASDINYHLAEVKHQ
jgi:hypothetical protein